MPSWDQDVKESFPLIAELNTPWRWNNAGTPELGQWILNCRDSLLNGSSIDLLGCPAHVHWHELSDNAQKNIQTQNQAQYRIRTENNIEDSLLIIGDSRNPRSRHNFASSSRGIDVVEPVDLGDVTEIASHMDNFNGSELADKILISVSLMMTGVGRSNINKRIHTILAGRNRTPATDIELAVKSVIESGGRNSIASLLSSLELCPDTRVFRKGAFSALKYAVSLSISDPSKTIKQSAEVIREQRRHQGDRRIPQRAIGSTLLLKGLESEHSLILDAGAMTPQNLYVALSRGAKSVTVFSNTSVVP
jgi:DNA helicase-2/ATP-dependent DNA helicase PcrA